jgi:hypothetical protein
MERSDVIKLIYDSPHNDGVRIEYTMADPVHISEIVRGFRQFLLGVSFHPGTINEYLRDDYDHNSYGNGGDDWDDLPADGNEESDCDMDGGGCPGCPSGDPAVPDAVPGEPVPEDIHKD